MRKNKPEHLLIVMLSILHGFEWEKRTRNQASAVQEPERRVFFIRKLYS